MRALLLGLAVLSVAPAAARAQRQAVTLRPVDRATVRIISLRGIDANGIEGRRSRVRRVVGVPSSTHGSGVVIGPNLVLTARHVVSGADAWIVVLPGSATPMPARPGYVDPEHDLAFVAVAGALPHRLPLPTQGRPLTLSERVSVSGYPLDLREDTPAAASGEVSRVTRNGELHLTMTVNPGHSGGPVIDGEGRLVGIVIARGRLDRGVEGLAVAVPLGPIVEARARVPNGVAAFEPEDAEHARAIAWVARVGGGSVLPEREAIERALERARQWTRPDADRDAVLAVLAWNSLVELLEANAARDIEWLPEGTRPSARLLLDAATQLARRALRVGPHVRRRYPVLRAIAIGRVQPYEPTPAR